MGLLGLLSGPTVGDSVFGRVEGFEVGKITASPPRALMLRSLELGDKLMTSPRSDGETAKQSDPLGTDPMVGREQEQYPHFVGTCLPRPST